MKKIEVMDCTLRDGGYVNNWRFGNEKIKNIIEGLIEANIDYIECGYLNENIKCVDNGITSFLNEEQLIHTIKNVKKINKPIAMIDFGKFNVMNLLEKEKSCLFGIRLAFHKYELERIKDTCHIIIKKGYKLFLQPMVTINYTDEELIKLIYLVNEIKPYAFYIVDSFGSIKGNDLQRMLYIVDNNLDKNIMLGFHSHNNLQLAYSNAQLVTQLQTNRHIIIDTSIFGMGRGAGNLNTELFVEYINDYYLGNYSIKPLLRVMDSTLNNIYNNKYWGYSLAYYISAIYNCHPNYATYLQAQNSLFLDDIENIISKIDETKKEYYDEEYIKQRYLFYMTEQKDNNSDFEQLSFIFKNKEVLMIGPGKSTLEYKKEINMLVLKKGVIPVSINCIYEWINTSSSYVFVSNKRRFKKIAEKLCENIIATTNIKEEGVLYRVSYEKLLNTQDAVKDNGGMMFLKLLFYLKVKKVYIIGVDGFSYDMDENYFMEDMRFSLQRDRMYQINYGMKKIIEYYSELMDIEFLNTPKFLEENNF